MLKKLFALCVASALAMQLSHAQSPKEGAIPTNTGFVIYLDNDTLMSYTVKIDGDVGIENYPILRQNNKYYIIDSAPMRVFGDNDKVRLQRYMKMELRKLKNSFEFDGEPESLMKKIDDKLFHLWSVKKATSDTSKNNIEVIKYYNLDFIVDDTIFKIQFPATTEDDKAARIAMYKLYKNMHFYDGLDTRKLQYAISQGKYFYN